MKRSLSLRPDSKGRITLGALAEGISRYDVEVDDKTGQIILSPFVDIPLQEMWLYKNRDALKKVRRGMRESSAKQTKPLGSFAKYKDDEVE